MTAKLRLRKAPGNRADMDAAKWRGSCRAGANGNPLCSFGMSRADEYRKRAALAEESAGAMSLSDERRRMLELAALWRELADADQSEPRLDGSVPLA